MDNIQTCTHIGVFQPNCRIVPTTVGPGPNCTLQYREQYREQKLVRCEMNTKEEGIQKAESFCVLISHPTNFCSRLCVCTCKCACLYIVHFAFEKKPARFEM